LTGIGQSLSIIDQNARSPRVQQYSIDIQRELPFGVAVEVAYVGSHSTHLTQATANININALNPSQVFLGGEITGAWDMIESAVREGILERALTRSAAATPVVPEQMGGYPRLRGATALVAAPHFAAPRVA